MNSAGKLLACCAAGAMLAACGGNDKKTEPAGRDVSYTGSTTALVISNGNVASTAAFANPSGMTSGPTYLGAASAGAPRVDVGRALALLREGRRDFAVALAGAVGSISSGCPGGGTRTIVSSTASSSVSTTGDYIQMTFAFCADGYGTTLNGTIRLDITGTDGVDPSLGPPSMTSGVTYGMKLTMTDFTAEDATGWIGMEGDMSYSQVWSSSTFRLQSTVTGTSLVISAGVGPTVTQDSLITKLPAGSAYAMESVEDYTDSTAATLFAEESGIDARFCSTGMKGCVNFETAQRVRQLVSELYPASGSVKLSDDAGHYVQVVPTNGSTGAVTVSWEIVLGAPTPDGTCNTTWSTMATDTCFP